MISARVGNCLVKLQPSLEFACYCFQIRFILTPRIYWRYWRYVRGVSVRVGIVEGNAPTMDIVTTMQLCIQLITCAHAPPLGVTSNQLLLSSASTPAPLLVAGPIFPPVTQGPISLLPGSPTSLSGAPGMPPAPYNAIYSAGAPLAPCSAVQSTGAPQSAAFQPITGMQWPQPTPYASPFMAPPAWPMYMPSYLPRPLSQPPFLQAQFEDLTRRDQDMEARELEIQRISRSINLKAV